MFVPRFEVPFTGTRLMHSLLAAYSLHYTSGSDTYRGKRTIIVINTGTLLKLLLLLL